MPRFQVTGPDGKSYEVTAPDGASESDVLSYVQSQMAQPKPEAPAPLQPPADRRSGKLSTPVDNQKMDISGEPALGEKWGKAVGGIGTGAMDAPYALAQLIARGVGKVAPEGSGLAEFAADRTAGVDIAVQQRERDRLQQRGGDTGIDWPRVIGSIAATAPITGMAPNPASLFGRVATGTGIGATSSALQPVDVGNGDFGDQKMRQVATGAAAGGAIPLVTAAAARVVRPNTAPAVDTLINENVALTPGQILGGTAKRVEDASTSIPFVGDAIRGAQRRSVETFNRAAINRALAPIGEQLADDVPMGRQAIDAAGRRISEVYDDVVSNLDTRVDQRFVTELQNLRNLAQNMLPQRAQQFSQILDEQLARKIPQSGVITGQTMKEAESALGRLGAQYRGSPDADQRLLGDALRQAQAVLRDLVARSNPQVRDRLAAINTSYANLLRVENAAGRIGSQDGVFTANALQGAVRQMDRSGRHRAFSRGNALMQDLSEAGRGVLPSSVPDSGTVLRGANIGGLLGLLGGYGVSPEIALTAGGAGAAGMAAYSRPIQSALQYLLAVRPQSAAPIAEAIRQSGPMAAGAVGPVMRLGGF